MSYRVGIVVWRIYTSPSRVSLARARSLFCLLLPSACYAGYTWGNVRLENLIGLCGTFHRLHEDQKSMFSGEEWLIPDPGSSATILYFSKTRIEPLRAPYSATGVGWGWKQGQTTELCSWRLLPWLLADLQCYTKCCKFRIKIFVFLTLNKLYSSRSFAFCFYKKYFRCVTLWLTISLAWLGFVDKLPFPLHPSVSFVTLSQFHSAVSACVCLEIFLNMVACVQSER